MVQHQQNIDFFNIGVELDHIVQLYETIDTELLKSSKFKKFKM